MRQVTGLSTQFLDVRNVSMVCIVAVDDEPGQNHFWFECCDVSHKYSIPTVGSIAELKGFAQNLTFLFGVNRC